MTNQSKSHGHTTIIDKFVAHLQSTRNCTIATTKRDTRAAPIPLFTDTSNTKYPAGKYLQVQVPIPSTLK